MHEANKARRFSVLGFPCNQFGKQEPGTNEEILAFARSKYDVAFPMFAKIDVNGPNADPVYAYLRGDSGDIKWNFTKFLVGRDGTVLKRYEPKVTPEQIAAELGDFL